MAHNFWNRLIKVSTIAQFSASKVSVVISGTTLATALSLKFPWLSWLWAMAAVATIGGVATALIFFSGWVQKEATYGQHLTNMHPRLDGIDKRLERIEKKLDRRR